VKARGGHIIAVTTRQRANLGGLVDHQLRVPATAPLLSPVLTTLPLQLSPTTSPCAGLRRGPAAHLAKSVTSNNLERGAGSGTFDAAEGYRPCSRLLFEVKIGSSAHQNSAPGSFTVPMPRDTLQRAKVSRTTPRRSGRCRRACRALEWKAHWRRGCGPEISAGAAPCRVKHGPRSPARAPPRRTAPGVEPARRRDDVGAPQPGSSIPHRQCRIATCTRAVELYKQPTPACP